MTPTNRPDSEREAGRSKFERATKQWSVVVPWDELDPSTQQLWVDAARAAAPQAQPPKGFALVPLRPNREMERVMEDEGWQWPDLLGAAEAITEDEYESLAAPERADDRVRQEARTYADGIHDAAEEFYRMAGSGRTAIYNAINALATKGQQ